MSAQISQDRPAVVATIGVFDGVHRGHRALIETVVRRAAEEGLRSLVVTFDPHPVTVLADPIPPHLLTGRVVQLRYLAELGVQRTWMLPFSRRLAAMDPRDFVEGLLLRYAAISELWVGHDFRFGHNRSGDAAWLRAEGRELGFAVHEFPALLDGDRPFSSTRIRSALAVGAIQEAVRMLGHSVLLEGIVGTGRGEGARLLVPTANLDLPAEQFMPANGVYAAWAETGGELVHAVVNIGVRPTLVDDPRRVVEAHLMDWTGELRGARLGLHLCARLRAEQKFAGLPALRAAVEEDMAVARRWLADHPLRPVPPSGGEARDRSES